MTELPEGWRQVTLADVCEYVRGVTYDKSDATNKPTQGFLPLLRATNIEERRIVLSDFVFIPESKVKPVQFLGRGDLLMAASSGSIQVVGKSGPAPEGFSGTFGAFCAVLRPSTGSNHQFLEYFISSPAVREAWSVAARGTNINNLKRESVLGTLMPLPSVAEQRRIVEILEEQFSRLDSALASIRVVREKSTALRRSLLHSAFSGQLTGGTKDWTDCTFGQVAKIASNLVSPEGFGSFPHLAPNHIEAQTGRLLELATVAEDGVTSPKHRFFAGQIVYSKIRPYLNKVVLVDFDGLCSADMYPIETQQDPKWLHYKMLSSEFVASVCGSQNRTVLPKTNVRDLSAVRVVVPPIIEQERMVEILDEQFSRLDNAMQIVNELEARIASERRSLLHAAFTGRLTAKWRELYV